MPRYRDELLQIGRLSPDYSLVKSFTSQESLSHITENVTGPVIDALGECLIQTGQMSSIEMLDWPAGKSEFIHASATTDISKEELVDLISKDNTDGAPTQSMAVSVELLDLRWFYTFRSNFIAFSTILTTMPVSFYSLKLTNILLNHYWGET